MVKKWLIQSLIRMTSIVNSNLYVSVEKIVQWQWKMDFKAED